MWLPSCLAPFTVGLAVVSQAPHMCGWSWAWAAAVPPGSWLLSYFKLATLMPLLTGHKSCMKFPESSQSLAWHRKIRAFFFRWGWLQNCIDHGGFLMCFHFCWSHWELGQDLRICRIKVGKCSPLPQFQLFLGRMVVDIHSPHLARSEICWKEAMKLV